jgi:hypothetical protein
MLNPADLARIEALENQITKLQNGLSSGQAASRNRIQTTGSVVTNPTSVTLNMLLNFAAVGIQAQSSGLFLVTISMQYTGATAANLQTVAITSQTSAAAITLSNAASVGSSPTGASPNSAFFSSAAGGILVSAGGGSAVTQAQLQWTTATGQTSGTFSWSGLCQNGVGTGGFTPFTKGNNVVFLFAVQSPVSAWNMLGTGLSLSVEELAA